MVARNIAAHEGQPGNAHRLEIVIVTRLPGVLLRLGKIADLGKVHQVRVTAFYIGKGAGPRHTLVTQADLVPTLSVAEHAIERLVVDFSTSGSALVLTRKKP